jgi:hypothetical protein
MLDPSRLAKSSSDADIEYALVRAAGGLRTMLADTGRQAEAFAESISLLLTLARREDRALLHWFHAAAFQLMGREALALKAARRYLNVRRPTGKDSDEESAMQAKRRKRVPRRKPHE